MTTESGKNWWDKVTLNDSRVVAKSIADEVGGKLEDLLREKEGQDLAFALYITAHFALDEVRANRVLGAKDEQHATRLLERLEASGLVRITPGDDGLPYLSIATPRTRDVILNALKTAQVEKSPRYSVEEAFFVAPYEGYQSKYAGQPQGKWQQRQRQEPATPPAQTR